MLKNLLLSAAMLLPTTALAAPSGITLSPDKAITTFHGAPGRATLPSWLPPAHGKKIIDTFGTAHAYNCCSGWTITNPGSAVGILQWVAYPITPKKSTSVTEIVEAIGFVEGGDSVTVALMADNNGSPGAVLSEKSVKNLEVFGNCCTVAVGRLKTPVPVTAGTTYWVGALLPKKSQSTTWDAWNYSSKDTNSTTFAYYTGTWNVSSGPFTAFAVYGN